MDFLYISTGSLSLVLAPIVKGKESEDCALITLTKGDYLTPAKFLKLKKNRNLLSMSADNESTRVIMLHHYQFYESMRWLSSNKHSFGEFVLDNVPLVRTFTSNVQNKVLNVFTE